MRHLPGGLSYAGVYAFPVLAVLEVDLEIAYGRFGSGSVQLTRTVMTTDAREISKLEAGWDGRSRRG